MKNFTLWLLILMTPLLVTGCKLKKEPVTEPEIVATEDLQDALEPEFESLDYGFSVQGPDGWVKQKDSLGMLVTYVNPGDPEVFQENITIAREMKGDLDLETYTKTTTGQIVEFFEGAEIGEVRSVRVKGQSAQKLNYKLSVEGLNLQAEQLIIDRPEEFLVITFMANTETFEAVKPALSGVLDSLRFNEQGEAAA